VIFIETLPEMPVGKGAFHLFTGFVIPRSVDVCDPDREGEEEGLIFH